MKQYPTDKLIEATNNSNNKYPVLLQYGWMETIIALLGIGGVNEPLRISNYEAIPLHYAAIFGTS